MGPLTAKLAAGVAIFLVAAALGGGAVRLGSGFADVRVVVGVAIVVAAVLLAVFLGTRGRFGRTPYW